MARVALIAAVSAAVGAGTLPVLLKQATPTEEAIARVPLAPARPREIAKPVAVAAAPLVVSTLAEAAPAAQPVAPPVLASAVTTPVAFPVPAASAALEPFPPVQPLTIDAAANAQPPAAQAQQPDASTATASPPPPVVEKPAWRKRVVHTRTTQRRYWRPRPFSIRALLAGLHLR